MDSLFQQFLRDLQNLIDRYSAAAIAPTSTPAPTINYNYDRLHSTNRLRFIAEHVATHFGLPLTSIICKPGKKGPNIHAEIRFLAWRLTKCFTRCSQNQIAAFYQRDHGSVTWGLKRFNELYISDPEFAAAYNLIEKNLAEVFNEHPQGVDA